ncbi:CheW-like domain-containing protein [Desulfonema magnum]|uniref:CheW-like domain-containing protein n=1 Tax=Desulfonema magnum TaxID=45655 RepID=A0A975BL22_9BACT|nr:CheW-like domain-containing protein [Desulfonema magnum]
MANFRDKVMLIADIRLRLSLDAADYTDQKCIIVLKIKDNSEKQPFGIPTDSFKEILGIKGKDIE